MIEHIDAFYATLVNVLQVFESVGRLLLQPVKMHIPACIEVKKIMYTRV
jgi:hypothetical protein